MAWNDQMSWSITKTTKWTWLRPAWASTQPDQSSLCTSWVAKDLNLLQADSKDSDLSGRMQRSFRWLCRAPAQIKIWLGAVARSEACSLGMQAAPSLIPTSGTFFRGDLVMKTFLRPFSLFRWFKKSSCQLPAKECALSTGKLPKRLAQEQCG